MTLSAIYRSHFRGKFIRAVWLLLALLKSNVLLCSAAAARAELGRSVATGNLLDFSNTRDPPLSRISGFSNVSLLNSDYHLIILCEECHLTNTTPEIQAGSVMLHY